MTMHSATTAVLFKEHQGINVQQNPINDNNGPLLMWGSQPPQPPVVFGEDGQGFAKGSGNTTHHFTLFSGDPKTAENGEKTAAGNMDYRGHLEVGFGQPLQICAKYPYAEQCYGLYSTHGTQIQGRIMLPLSMNADGGPIYVNAKQYNGIMRRRKKRAEAELENRVLRLRKPYLHLSRHLHAMRRPRGNGGRFLNTKSNSSSSNGNTIDKATGSRKAANDRLEEKQQQQQQLQQYHHPTDSQISEVLQSDNGMNNGGGSRSTSPGSEVTSTTHHFFSNKANNTTTSTLHHQHPFLQMNHNLQYPGSFHQGFQINHVANSTGLGIATASGNYLKV